MIATNKLRFVERKELDTENSTHEYIAHRTFRVLQQWWEFETIEKFERQIHETPFGEWRDVPIEEEE